jgi:hypothetical protein
MADAPAWCAKAEGRLDSNSKDAITGKDPRWALYYLVGATCKPDQEAQTLTKELAAARAKWNKKLDMTEQDWADVAEWASQDQGSRMNSDIPKPNKKAWSTLSPVEQYGLIAGDFNDDGPAYSADALGAKLTEVGRFGYIRTCLKARDDEQPVTWAMCQPDIDAFDRKKFTTELRMDTAVSGYQRMSIRLLMADFDQELKDHAEAVKKLFAKDAGYQTVFKTAAQGYKDFAKTDAAMIQLAADMDDARITNSRKAFDGCSAKAWPAWKKAVSGIPAKKFANFKREPGDENEIVQAAGVIAGDPAGYLATVSLYICEGIGGERGKMDYLIKAIGNTASRWPGYRGPRTSAQTAVMANGVTLDDRDAKIDYPDARHAWMEQNMSSGGGGRGVVASVKVTGDKAVVTFKKEFEKQEQCTSWKSSNRITQITSSGSLIYESWCTASKSVTVDRSFGPQTVKARYVEGLKPGMVFTNTEDVAGVVYAKNGAKQPVSIASAPLK